MKFNHLCMAGIMLGVAVSGCECAEVPFEQEYSGTFTVELGSDPECSGDPDPEIDEENGTYYDIRYTATGTECTIHVDEWRGSLAELADVQAQIDEQISAAGLDPDSAGVDLQDAEVSSVNVSLVTASGGDFDESRINAYTATANVNAGDVRIEPAIEVSGQGDGQPDVTTTDDSAGFADAVQAAIDAESRLDADGDAEVTVPFDAMVELTDNGAGPGVLRVDYTMTLSGVILLSVGG